MKIHDSGYKRLLSNKTIFRQLIETFVEEEWVQFVDFEHAERVDKSFVSEHYKETESDIIYRVPIQQTDSSTQEVYFYILIEFQSTVQRLMAVRVLHYISSFYMDYQQSRPWKDIDKLPAILPIVLYNGNEKWTAPTNIRELVEEYPPLGNFQLGFEYLKLAENEFTLNQLLGIRNIISTLFLVEAHYDITLLSEELLKLYDKETDREALTVFLNWFRQLALHGRIDEAEYGSLAQNISSKEEVRSMLLTALEKERETIRQEALEQGLEQGIERGIERGIINERRDNVRAMHTKGFAIDVIADIIGITNEEVEALINHEGNADDKTSSDPKLEN